MLWIVAFDRLTVAGGDMSIFSGDDAAAPASWSTREVCPDSLDSQVKDVLQRNRCGDLHFPKSQSTWGQEITGRQSLFLSDKDSFFYQAYGLATLSLPTNPE